MAVRKGYTPGRVSIVPIGGVGEDVLLPLRDGLEEVLGLEVRLGGAVGLPEGAYDKGRDQYISTALLTGLRTTASGELLLGVADVDLYARSLRFVFGEADPPHGVAVVSVRRLREGYYGREEDEALFRMRALKEAVHELGHLFGLGHCPDVKCVMHFSNSLEDTDVKGYRYCQKCQVKA
ncbi:MAG: archaemetzincin family Zn-dependent metalloprotease [Candidatus Hydrothermarchaeota archaeon]